MGLGGDRANEGAESPAQESRRTHGVAGQHVSVKQVKIRIVGAIREPPHRGRGHKTRITF